MKRFVQVTIILSCVLTAYADNYRRPINDEELQYWLQNMVWHHRFTVAEMSSATGMQTDEVENALDRFKISEDTKPFQIPGDPLLVLPYPGGRHPRIGFLDGAIDPQRETKVSVFTPWDDSSYVVIDIPEAIWSNLGLTYLAHTHLDALWTKSGINLTKLEWKKGSGGRLSLERELPNGIQFGALIEPFASSVAMRIWIHNGSEKKLTGLKAQVCVMLKGISDFTDQKEENKRFNGCYAACKSRDGKRWIISAWQPCQRVWHNRRVPCFHSDPKFIDCEVGKAVTANGRLWFFEGDNIDSELDRISSSGWDRNIIPDIREFKADLKVPLLVNEKTGPGIRTKLRHPGDQTPEVYHVLYLPEDWEKGKSYPVIVEFAGNGPYRDGRGDISTGYVEGSNLGYGLSGGRGFIWLCLPYLNGAGNSNVRSWWGDPPQHDPRPTVAYCKRTVASICADFGGDAERVILCGFSRGAIACNYIGLYDDEISKMWCGFIPYSHYDGVTKWGFPDSDRISAGQRLDRLSGRPQLIISESSERLMQTRQYLKSQSPKVGKFTFLESGFRNHNDAWILRPSATRSAARNWLNKILRISR